jgi:hypothetical protein
MFCQNHDDLTAVSRGECSAEWAQLVAARPPSDWECLIREEHRFVPINCQTTYSKRLGLGLRVARTQRSGMIRSLGISKTTLLPLGIHNQHSVPAPS